MTPLLNLTRLAVLLCFFQQIADAAEPDAQVVRKFQSDIVLVGKVYTGKRFEAIRESYSQLLKSRDINAWKQAVETAGQKKQRISFLAEFFAYADETEIVPVVLKSDDTGKPVKWPLTTAKNRLMLFVFSPRKSKTDEPLSEAHKKTTYIIIRGKVPLKNNPYGVVLCQAVRGYTPQQIQRLVQSYQKSW